MISRRADPSTDPRPEPRTDAVSRALRVLLVEDEPALASAVCAALRRRGHEVAHANSAAEALELREPEVLITDIHLDGSSGLDLLAELRARGARPHAVLIAGMPSLEDCRRAMRLGAADAVSYTHLTLPTIYSV